jgi:hypothetical protein
MENLYNDGEVRALGERGGRAVAPAGQVHPTARSDLVAPSLPTVVFSGVSGLNNTELEQLMMIAFVKPSVLKVGEGAELYGFFGAVVVQHVCTRVQLTRRLLPTMQAPANPLTANRALLHLCLENGVNFMSISLLGAGGGEADAAAAGAVLSHPVIQVGTMGGGGMRRRNLPGQLAHQSECFTGHCTQAQCVPGAGRHTMGPAARHDGAAGAH